MRPKVFADIVVHPTQMLLKPPFLLFRGGPDFPRFWTQVRARHCRYALPIPLDLRPRASSPPVASRPVGAWCGPVSRHFGHAIADFGGRLARSSQLADDVPLVFSGFPGDGEAPAFLHQILAHFGVPSRRLLIVSEPTVFERLLVFPQAERLFGRSAGAAHLDLLDRLAGDGQGGDGGKLFVSRGGRPNGRIAGEAYLERVLQDAGFATFRPELFSLGEQLARYRRASHILFSEGSAIHALQLLGRIGARVSVLVRRPGSRIASALIAPRVASLRYVECLRGVVQGVRADGRAQPSAGISVLDETGLPAALATAGIDIGHGWDEARFLAARDVDLQDWIRHRGTRPAHGNERAAIRRSLRSAGLPPLV